MKIKESKMALLTWIYRSISICTIAIQCNVLPKCFVIDHMPICFSVSAASAKIQVRWGKKFDWVQILQMGTRCDNLIPGMALRKQNLLTCALAAAVAFEILSSWSYALRETMVPLPEAVLKIVFRNSFLKQRSQSQSYIRQHVQFLLRPFLIFLPTSKDFGAGECPILIISNILAWYDLFNV
jgi:hypothetical protein